MCGVVDVVFHSFFLDPPILALLLLLLLSIGGAFSPIFL